MTTQYKKFTRLIAKWPIDNTKGERYDGDKVYAFYTECNVCEITKDLGKFLRDRVKAAFESDNKQNLDTEHCNRQYVSLNKLADNHYRNKYKRTRASSATGLSSEECNVVLSSEVLDYLKEENKGFFRKLFNKD